MTDEQKKIFSQYIDAAQDQKTLGEHLLFRAVYTWDQNDVSGNGE